MARKGISKIEPGDIYEDCAYHPVLCTTVDGDEVTGISLIDGSWPRACSLSHCGVRKLSLEEAIKQKLEGPTDVPPDTDWQPGQQWWLNHKY